MEIGGRDLTYFFMLICFKPQCFANCFSSLMWRRGLGQADGMAFYNWLLPLGLLGSGFHVWVAMSIEGFDSSTGDQRWLHTHALDNDTLGDVLYYNNIYDPIDRFSRNVWF
jgi:hypothetical protein